MTDSRSVFDQLESLGEATVREQINNGELNAQQVRDARAWLGLKEIQKKAISELVAQATVDQANSARNANLIALAALVLSIIATAIAVAAYLY